jgi:hypothetical protein
MSELVGVASSPLRPPRGFDYSRLTYSEILTDEKKETVAAFWTRATRSSQ